MASTSPTPLNVLSIVNQAVLDRFFAKHSIKSTIEINDFGATPGMVALRLQQALEQSKA
jgi:malonate decarboxylase delta subunit